jgi:hypothetical protein
VLGFRYQVTREQDKLLAREAESKQGIVYGNEPGGTNTYSTNSNQIGWTVLEHQSSSHAAVAFRSSAGIVRAITCRLCTTAERLRSKRFLRTPL